MNVVEGWFLARLTSVFSVGEGSTWQPSGWSDSALDQNVGCYQCNQNEGGKPFKKGSEALARAHISFASLKYLSTVSECLACIPGVWSVEIACGPVLHSVAHAAPE